MSGRSTTHSLRVALTGVALLAAAPLARAELAEEVPSVTPMPWLIGGRSSAGSCSQRSSSCVAGCSPPTGRGLARRRERREQREKREAARTAAAEARARKEAMSLPMARTVEPAAPPPRSAAAEAAAAALIHALATGPESPLVVRAPRTAPPGPRSRTGAAPGPGQ